MSERSATHATFNLERSYEASPARVFTAWADPECKERWFVGGNGWKETARELDFRVGGTERLVGVWPDGTVSSFEARYHEIIPNQRIIYTYEMHLGETRISASLITVQFRAADGGTCLVFTEQVVLLDGYDDPGGRDRERGTCGHLDRLAAYLQDEVTIAEVP
jgi:uncharacterized protein YndB with AHSA1/START domain